MALPCSAFRALGRDVSYGVIYSLHKPANGLSSVSAPRTGIIDDNELVCKAGG